MLERFATDFTARFPELVGAKLAVALSGGADSVALLHLLAAADELLGCTVVAVHVHHHARGDEADRDAAFCADLCTRLEVAFERADIDREPVRGLSREAFWRRERYRLLEEARTRHACAAVATAHTLEDQAETVLLKLLRGAGPRGVAGIRPRRGAVVRPLLGFHRDELREWLAARSIPWCEDSSNALSRAPRGFVRHELLPQLRRREPAAVEHLAAFAAVLGEDERLLEAMVRDRLPEITPRRAVPLAALATSPRPLLRRWVLALAARLRLSEAPGRGQLEAVESMLAGGRPAAVDLGGRWVLRRRGGRAVLSPPPLTGFEPVAARVPSQVALAGGFVARLGGAPTGGADHAARLAPGVADRELQWRSPVPGEPGPDGRGRLIERLARAGVPAEWRRAWPVLAAGGTMIWVPGLDTASGWDGDEATGVTAEVEEPWRRHTRS